MNSEELEKSLRTEFESYLKDALANMRQEVFQLQYKIDSELEKYKAQIDEVFKEFSEKAREDHQLGEDFQDSIVEHLRLARDDGATITAQAIAEAEKLGEKSSPAAASLDVSDLRDAINDISSQTSQATILKTLIDHAEKFVPRGAFFVVKNQNFVGWRVFGNESPSGDDDIREIYFEISRPTVLSESVNALRTVESAYGSFEEDSVFLSPLDFGEPDRMFAVPLVARGRGVAAVYADAGEGGSDINIAALETLVRIAGLTVELLASAAHVTPATRPSAPAPSRSFAEAPAEAVEETAEAEETAEIYEPEEETVEAFETADVATEEEVEAAEEEGYEVSSEDETEAAVEESYEESYETAPAVDYEEYSDVEETSEEAETEYSYETVEAAQDAEPAEETTEEAEFETVEADDETYQVSDEAETSTEFETSSDYEPEAVQMPTEAFDQPASEEFDISEYLADETHSEALTDDFVSDDDSIEEVQAGDEAEEAETLEYQDSSETVAVAEEEAAAETVEFDEPSQTEEETSLGEEAAEDFEVVEDPIPVSASEPQEQESVEEPQEEAAAETAPPVRSRLAGRNVDLPIEVSEDERKLHNDARRFARLLVSEIKLYNEQKVAEGRNSGDLYERLQEAIDRSREMYDKRVQPPVAERFDYFHYEVVNTLGEGEESKLGSKYPGATV